MKNDLCGLHDLPELIQSAEETVLPAVEKTPSASRTSYGFSIITQQQNSRIRLNKALSAALDIRSSVYIMPAAGKKCILIATSPLYASAIEYAVTGDNKGGYTYVYNTEFAKQIVKLFGLSFDGKSTLTYTDIEVFETAEKMKYAVVQIPSPPPDTSPVSAREVNVDE